MKVSITFPASPLPSGYRLYRAPVWPLVDTQLGIELSTQTFGVSSFMVIPLWVAESQTFSAVQKYSVMNRADMDKLEELQPEATKSKAMNWLVYSIPADDPSAPSKGVSAMWTGSTLDYKESQRLEVGTMLWGNQTFAASETVYPVNIKGTLTDCRKVLPFKREYWTTKPAHMFPRACIAGKDNALVYEWDSRGAITTMLQVLDPSEFPFAGGKVPSAFYVPARWL